MSRKRIPGLYKRKGIWHIDKQVNGKRLCESTGYSDLQQAEQYLARRIEELRQAAIYGVRPKRIFREAAMKYLLESQHKRSIQDDAMHLKQLDPFIGELFLEQVHNETLKPFVLERKQQGRKNKTINLALAVVRRILNLASTEWLDENGLSWLQLSPKLKMLQLDDTRKPYPLDWKEQNCLFSQLPPHLKAMAEFKVNTGCREQEVCCLRWEWEIPIPELSTSIFLLPASIVKNKEDRLVILNDIAKNIVDSCRGIHPTYVFTFRGNPITAMNNTAWQKARKRVNLPQVRIHDLKHTFGRRLRAAGVSFEDRQDLLGHRSHRITTHYCVAELKNLLNAANSVCGSECSSQPILTLIKNGLEVSSATSSRKTPASLRDEKQVVDENRVTY